MTAASLVLLACSGKPDRPAEAVLPPTYSTPVVLLVSPDAGELARLRDTRGDDFYVIADDAMWYRAAANALLDSLRIPTIEVGRGEARFLVDGKPRLVQWSDADLSWFAVVYDGRNAPRVVADVDLQDALRTFPDH